MEGGLHLNVISFLDFSTLFSFLILFLYCRRPYKRKNELRNENNFVQLKKAAANNDNSFHENYINWKKEDYFAIKCG